MRPPQPTLFSTWARVTGLREPGRARLACSIVRVASCACRRLVAVADAWLVRRVEEFDLVTPFSGGAALEREEAAAWEAKQKGGGGAARHAKELGCWRRLTG